MNKTVAKFKIDSLQVKPGAEKDAAELTASAVTTGSKENEKFFSATPSGQLNLGVVDPEVLGDLKEGDEIYLTIEKATAEADHADATVGTL